MKIVLILMILQQILSASTGALTLNEAIDLLQSQNLQIKAATLDVAIAKEAEKSVAGTSWGKLDFIQDAARSNDAGNIFGFKLTSREASFGDFGFNQFDPSNPDILNVQPDDLNYPKDRNFFQSKLRYEVPLFTGFTLSSYGEIMHSMTKMKSLKKRHLSMKKTFS